MANKSVLSNQDVNSAGGSRHGFAIGQNFKFSMSTGMLLPCYSCFVNVGEKIKGKPSFFIRADHLAAPVMGDVDVFVDCFFVPLRHLFAPAEQWIYQIEDNQSDLFNTSIYGYGQNHPVLNAGQHPFYFMTENIFRGQNIFGGWLGFDLHRLLMHLGYNPQAIFDVVVGSDTPVVPNTHMAFNSDFTSILRNTQSPNMPLYKFGAYQKIYYDFYRNTEFEPNNVLAYNYDSAYSSGSVNISSLYNPSSSRSGMLELHYRDINKDYFTAVHPSPLFSGIGMLVTASDLLQDMNNWLYADSNPVAVATSVSGTDITSIQSTNSQIITSDDSNRWKAPSASTFPYGRDVQTASSIKNLRAIGDNSYNVVHDHAFSTRSLGINTAALRGMFAFDKLLRITQRAGKHVDDQTLAHFGYKQPAGVSGETYVLKQYHSIFHFGEVTSTAQTAVAGSSGGADLGQMAGRGVAMLGDQDDFDFVAPAPGIFMAIISCAPRRTYLGAVEKDGYKVYLADFFKPSIDNLGQQPMHLYEGGQPTYVGYATRGLWQYRFMEDKIKFDKASLIFATNDKSPWIFGFEPPFITDIENYTQGYRSHFKVKPTDINNVFIQGYDSRPNWPDNTDSDDNYMNFCKAYLSDPFQVDFKMQLTRVSKMSIYGEPVLGGIC